MIHFIRQPKKISPLSTQKWHGKGSKAWFIIQMSGGNLRGEGIFVFFGWGSKPKTRGNRLGFLLVTKESKGGRKNRVFDEENSQVTIFFGLSYDMIRFDGEVV